MKLDDLRFLVSQSIIDQLAMYMMISLAPPKAEWEILERVLNQLMRDEPVGHGDLKALEGYRAKCYEEGKEVLENPGETVQLKTSDAEFQAVFNYCVVRATTSLVNAQMKHETYEVNNEMMTALTATRQLHEIAYPSLQKIVGEWFQLKQTVR